MEKPLSQMLVLLLLMCGVGLGQEHSAKTHYPAGSATIVASVALTNQTTTTGSIKIFTPTRLGLYRINAYIAGEADASQNADFNLRFDWLDLTSVDNAVSLSASFLGGTKVSERLDALTFVPVPGTSVYYIVGASDPAPVNAKYTVMFTIEQLQ
jgi:hypothetical protein